MKCPCQSGLSYLECCNEYHSGKILPENALQLMRSRYSAYAVHNPDYIIETTHPENLSFSTDIEAWKKSILEFCKKTDFRGLKIHEFVEGNEEAFVTFHAHLQQKNKDISFEETSRFIRIKQQWLYHSGNIH